MHPPGADPTLSPLSQDVKQAVLDLTDDAGCEVVVEAVGSGKAIEQCYDLVAAGGKVLVFGVAPEKDTFTLPPSTSSPASSPSRPCG